MSDQPAWVPKLYSLRGQDGFTLAEAMAAEVYYRDHPKIAYVLDDVADKVFAVQRIRARLASGVHKLYVVFQHIYEQRDWCK